PPPPAPSAPSPPPPPQPPTEPAYQRPPITSPRSLHQLSIYLLGSTCLLLSTTLTRRAIHRRHLRLTPSYFAPNTNPHEYFSPFADACQAFNLATMNCASVGIMMLGGVMWVSDISNLQEARKVLRGRLGYERIYESEEDVPNSISQMILQAGEVRFKEEEEE
ncbi:hypothetical protein COCMIDRAFT_55238, partial [Bipolaris oryzae ATCC 44560]